MTARSPVVIIADTEEGMARAFTIRTIPGHNILVMPTNITRISQIFIRLGGLHDILLMPVAQNADITLLNCLGGRPAWYQAASSDFDCLQVRIWPIPDAEYELCVFATAATMPDNPFIAADRITAGQEKAIALLHAWLTPAQKRSLAEHDHFVVKGSVTGALYRITRGSVYNVQLLDKRTGLSTEKLCFAPENVSYPGDIMLAQKIMLETDENRALKIANKQPTQGEPLFPA